MKTKGNNMNVELIHNTPLTFIKDGIRTCWASQKLSDDMGPKDTGLIDRIANKAKHSSVLRHSLFIFNITASTKTLLAFTRHKAGVEFSVQSSRYTTSKLASSMTFTKTNNGMVNTKLDAIIDIVNEAIAEGAADDDIAMLLPQAYDYTFQVSMNLQAIQHLGSLRLSKGAHWDIRNMTEQLYLSMPPETKYLLQDIVDSAHSTDFKQSFEASLQ